MIRKRCEVQEEIYPSGRGSRTFELTEPLSKRQTRPDWDSPSGLHGSTRGGWGTRRSQLSNVMRRSLLRLYWSVQGSDRFKPGLICTHDFFRTERILAPHPSVASVAFPDAFLEAESVPTAGEPRLRENANLVFGLMVRRVAAVLCGLNLFCEAKDAVVAPAATPGHTHVGHRATELLVEPNSDSIVHSDAEAQALTISHKCRLGCAT